MPYKEYQNYLFDLYGTLVDIHTDEDHLPLWQRMSVLLSTMGLQIPPTELRRRYLSEVTKFEARAKTQRGQGAEIDIGPVFASFFDGSVTQPDERIIANIAHIFRALSLQKLRLFPGAAEMLNRLRRQGKGVYLLSNAQELFTLPELQALNLTDYFDGIVISSREGFKKPDVRLYHIALERYGLNPGQTVMVGNDDRADCWGAHDAGLDSMYIFTEQSPVRTKPLPENCRLLQDISQVI